MFAYCNNIPVICSDPSGNYLIIDENRNDNRSEYTDSGTGGHKDTYVVFKTPVVKRTLITQNIFNCYAYALGRKYWTHVGDLSGSYPNSFSLNDCVESVVADIESTGRKVCTFYSLSEAKAALSDSSNLIAMRTGENDYHFMRYRNGKWYQKCGNLPAEQVDTDNPSYCSWNLPTAKITIAGGGMYYAEITGYYENYYDSRTVYFVITP